MNLIIQLRKFILLFFLKLAISQSIDLECGLGCDKCISQEQCKTCKVDFQYNQVSKLCVYEKCDQNLLAQKISDNKNEQYQCVSICDYNFYANYNENTCNKIHQCSQSFNTQVQFNNKIRMISSGIYKRQFILLIYDSFLNLFRISTGQFLNTISYSILDMKLVLKEQILFKIIFESSSIINWDIENGTEMTIFQSNNGQFNSESDIYLIDKAIAIAISFNTSEKICNINIFQIQLNKIINIISIQQNQQLVKLYYPQILFIQINNYIKIQEIKQDDQKNYIISPPLVENLICNVQSNQQIINIIDLPINIQLLSQFELIMQFANQNYLFILKSNEKKCFALENMSFPYFFTISYNKDISNNLIFVQYKQSIGIYSNDLVLLQKQTFDSQIIDFKIADIASKNKKKIYILTKNNNIESFLVILQNNQASLQQISNNTIQILSPIGINVQYQTNDDPYIFVYNYDCHVFISGSDQIKFILQSFETDYTSNKSSIISLIQSSDEKYLISISNDGAVLVWSILNRYRGILQIQFSDKKQTCYSANLFIERYIIVLCEQQFVIYDIINPFKQVNIPIEISTASSMASVNSNYIVINKDKCIQVFDIMLKQTLKDCFNDYSNISYMYLTFSNYLIIVSGRKIIKYNLINLQSPLQQAEDYTHDQDIIYLKFRIYSDQSCRCIFYDTGLNLVILNPALQFDHKMFIPYIFKIIDFNFISNRDVEDYMILGIFSDATAQKRYRIYIMSKGSSDIFLVSSFQLANSISNIIYQKMQNGDENYNISTLISFSQYSLLYPIVYNIKTKYIYFGQYHVLNSETAVQNVVYPQNFHINDYIGSSNGYVGYASIFKNSIKQVHQSTSDQPIYKLYENLRFERYFILSKNVFVYHIYSDEFDEVITFNDQINFVQSCEINHNLKIIIFIKNNELVLKSYKSNKIYRYTDINLIQGVFVSDIISKVFIYGQGLSIYTLDLKFQSILYQNVNISYCIFKEKIYLCKYRTDTVIGIDPFTMLEILTFKVQNILETFKLAIDETNQRIFVYEKIVQIYSYYGQFIVQFSEPASTLMEFNLYGDKIVLITIGGGYIYERKTLRYVSMFNTPIGGEMRRTEYIPKQNMIAYFTDEIRYGQVMFYSLTSLSDIGTFTSQTFNNISDIIRLFPDPEMNEVIFFDSIGNMGNIQYQGSISSSSSYTLEYLFREKKPVDMNICFNTNSILAANSEFVYRVNYSSMTKQMSKYFRNLNKIKVHISINGQSHFLIVDKSNIIYQYYNFQLIFLINFNDKILSIQYVNQEKQLIAVVFLQKIIVYQVQSNDSQTIQISQFNSIDGYKHKQFICNSTIFTYDQKIIEYDFINKTEIFSYQLKPSQDIISSHICEISDNIQTIIFSFLSGEVLLYDKKNLKIKELMNPDIPVKQIIKVIHLDKSIFVFQKNGDFHIFYEDPSKLPQYVNKNNFILDNNQNDLNNVIVDSTYERLYQTYFDTQNLYVINQKTQKFIKYLSFSNDQYNSLLVGQNILILYSSFQLNIYNRESMEFLYSIIRSNRLDTIDKLSLLNDIYLVIVFIAKVEVYILDNDKYSFLLIDSIITQFPELLLNRVFYNEQNEPILQTIFYSKDQVFEKYYSINLILSDTAICNSKFQSDKSIDQQQKLNTVYKPNSGMKYSFFFEIIDSIESFNNIAQKSVQLIISPLIQNQNDKERCQNILKLNEQSFLSMKNDIIMRCFSLIFQQEGTYYFNQFSRNVIFEDIMITNQQVDNIYFEFIDFDTILMENFKINLIQKSELNSRSQINQYFILIEKVDEVNIYNLEVFNNTMKVNSPIFLIKNVNSVLIKNSKISDNLISKLFRFEDVKSLKIDILEVTDNKSLDQQMNIKKLFYFFEIIGSQTILISNTTILRNNNINMIYTSKISVKSDIITTLQTDVLQIIKLDAQENNFTEEFQTHKGEDNTIFFLTNTKIVMDQINYENNLSNISIQTSDIVNIKNSSFQKNSASNGGAISIKNINQLVDIYSCTFKENIALGSGGAIYIEGVKQIVIREHTSISNNQAQIGGGIRSIDIDSNEDNVIDQIDISSNSIVKNNIGEIYGNNIESYPKKIKLIFVSENISIETEFINFQDTDSQPKQILLNNYQSGGYLNMTLQFSDSENRIVNISQSKYHSQTYPKSISNDLSLLQFWMSAYQNSTIYLSDESLVNINQYDQNILGFIKKDLQISGIPSSEGKIILNYSTNKFDNLKSLVIQISFRQCQTGEIFKIQQKSIVQCYQCPIGFYSLTPVEKSGENLTALLNNPQELDNIVCKKCPDSAISCNKNEIKISNGYWRASNYTDEIIQCEYNENSCIPENSDSKEGCLKGYIGPLCEQCDTQGMIWGDKYIQSVQKYRCQLCKPIDFQIAYIIIFIILVIFYIIIQVLLFVNSYYHYQTCYYLRIAQIIPFSVSCVRDQSNFYLKILINYFQIYSIILHLKIKILPNFVVAGPSLVGNFLGNITIEMNCLYPQHYVSKYGSGRLRQISQFLTAPTFILLLLICFKIFEKFKLFKVEKYHKYTLFSFLLMFFQPDSLNLFSQSLTCRNIGSLEVFAQDMLYNCSDQDYNLFLRVFTIPNLLFWILFPIIPFISLYRNRKLLDWCSAKFKLGYFYLEFNQKYYYWEFIRIYMKVLIVLFYTFFQNNKIVSIVIVNLILTLYVIAVIYLKPFQIFSLKRLEVTSFILLQVLIVLQVLNDQLNNMVFEILFAFFNISFVCFMIYTILKYKIINPYNVIGRCFGYIIRSILSHKSYEKFIKFRKISFVCLTRWKKIQRNMSFLTKLKALHTIDMRNTKDEEILHKQLNAHNSNISNIEHRRESFGYAQKMIHNNNQNNSMLISQEIALKTPELNNIYTYLKKRDYKIQNQSLHLDQQKEIQNLLMSFHKLDEKFQNNNQNDSPQIKYSNDHFNLILPQILKSNDQQHIEEIQSSISLKKIEDLNQYDEMFSNSPQNNVLISEYQHAFEKSNQISRSQNKKSQ